jgi:uncharacterized protein (TIGR00725 family)
MVITVIGSSNPDPKGYEEAYRLGKLIGQKGHVLKNGAYSGTMEASAKGCIEAGGEVIGIAVKGHKIDKMGQPNSYNTKVVVTVDVLARIRELLICDLFVVLKGNIGTLEEMFIAWVNALEKKLRSIVIVGEEMNNFLQYLIDHHFLKEEHFDYINKIPSVDHIFSVSIPIT